MTRQQLSLSSKKNRLCKTQLPSVSPPHVTSVTTKTITIKEIFYPLAQNINPLTKDDLKNFLDESTLQAKLCGNSILVSVDELQKIVTNVTREKVNPQEPPSIIPLVTNLQLLGQILEATSIKVDTIKKKIAKENDTTIGHKEIGQIDLFAPITQGKIVSQIIVVEQGKFEETQLTPKV